MNHLSLFTGMGMLDLAAAAMGFTTLATAEIEPFCQRVLRERFQSALHFEDVCDVKAVGVPAEIDLVSGGFPCQDLSPAGNGAGLTGPRSGLWREFARIVNEFQPRMVMVENVALLRRRGLNSILWDLDRHGFDVEWDCVPALAVGAYHVRDRLWIIATRRDLSLIHPIGQPMGPVEALKGMRVDMPRSGRMRGGDLFETTPRATRRDCNQARARGTLVYPGVPSDPSHPLLPTMTTRDGTEGPGSTPKREGGKNLRTYIRDEDGDYKLNPVWVEWFMGLPAEWTNPDIPNHELVPFVSWAREPRPRTDPAAPYRRARLHALGNGLVPQAASIMLRDLMSNTKTKGVSHGAIPNPSPHRDVGVRLAS